MPPRLYLFSGSQSLAIRTSKRVVTNTPVRQQLRCFAADKKPIPKNENEEPKGSNQGQFPTVSEEAAMMSKITGETGPDMEQGTPVQEILKRDKKAQENAPEVLKQELAAQKTQNGSKNGSSSRSFSTASARKSPELTEQASGASAAQPPPPPPTPAATKSTESAALVQSILSVAPADKGTKFGLPEKTMERTDHLRHRYHPVIAQLTKLMMKDGKLPAAQRNMDHILNFLRTAPPPNPSANVLPLLESYYSPPDTGYIPAHASKALQKQLLDPNRKVTQTSVPPTLVPSLLPLDPVKYLILAIDSVAPLVKVRAQRGVLGGGAALQIPVPLPLKQRRRTSIMWILAAADKRKETKLADRVASELVGVVEGRSGVWARREAVHKLGIAARSNIRFTTRRK